MKEKTKKNHSNVHGARCRKLHVSQSDPPFPPEVRAYVLKNFLDFYSKNACICLSDRLDKENRER